MAIMVANRLGVLDVDKMLEQMTPEQFSERVAYEFVQHETGSNESADGKKRLKTYDEIAAGFGLHEWHS